MNPDPHRKINLDPNWLRLIRITISKHESGSPLVNMNPISIGKHEFGSPLVEFVNMNPDQKKRFSKKSVFFRLT